MSLLFTLGGLSVGEPSVPLDYSVLFIGVFGLLAFTFGLVAGKNAVSMGKFALAMIGPSLIAIEALIVTLYLYISGDGGIGPSGIGLYAILLLALSILGIVFIAGAKQAFH